MTAPRWIDVDGAANVRDLAGLPTDDGRVVQPGRLIRADSLQLLTDTDIRHLVDDLQVRAVADLRTGVEVVNDGPGPMTREPDVDIAHLSLFPEPADAADLTATDDGPVILPWQRDSANDADSADNAETDDGRRRGASGVYLRYLDERGDSVLASLRMIAGTDGATIVHCAAGKDRTGVVIAFALAEVGVTREAIVADYTRSAERIEGIYARLGARRTYAGSINLAEIAKHTPRAVTMERLLDAIDEQFGGIPAWLRANGWTDVDAAALRHHLLDP